MATPQFLAQQQKERDDRLYAEVQALLAVAERIEIQLAGLAAAIAELTKALDG